MTQMLDPIYDMHCHLGFYKDFQDVALKLDRLGVSALCATVTSSEYERVSAKLGACSNVEIGLGLHPWWIGDKACVKEENNWTSELEQARELIRHTRIIGEVGLDFSRAHIASARLQTEVLSSLLAACTTTSHVLSIHAVASASAVLDLIEKHRVFDSSVVILHWFSGSGDELLRAIRMGCMFSVGLRMLTSKRGRAYVHQIPQDQLLLETDLPSSSAEALATNPIMIRERLDQTLEVLAQALNLESNEISESVAERSRRILFHNSNTLQ